MLELKDILLGVIAPLLLSGAIAAGLSFWRNPLGGAAAISAGFLAGYILVFAWPGLRPVSDYEWIVPGAIVVAIIGTAAELATFRLRWIWGLIIPVLAWLLVRVQLTGAELIGVIAVGWVWWALWNQLVTRSPGTWSGMVMTGVAGFTALVLMLSDSQRFGQMGLALIGATAAVWVVGWLTRNDLWRGAGLAWAFLLYGLLVNGKYWAGLSWPSAILLLSAPLMAWVGEAPGVRQLTPWKRQTLRIAAVVVPVLVATAIAAVEFTRAQSSDGYDYY